MIKKKRRKKQSIINEEIDLALKYRPKTMDDFFGNALLKKSLSKLIEKNKIPHAVLFQGPKGCGKTSMARILSNALNCSEFDLKEMDVAHFSGIATSRAIREVAYKRPIKGKIKVFIIDEIALLGRGGSSEKNEAQSALLKILEEPPKHCYFFLCTTDPQNVLGTIKSRCVHYTVNTLSEKQIIFLLIKIIKNEFGTSKKISKRALMQIAKDSLGHPRDAIKILESIIHLDEKDQVEGAKRKAEKQQEAITLCRALSQKKKWKDIADILKGLEKESPENIRRLIRKYYKSMLLNGVECAYVVLDVFKTPFYNIDAENELVKCTYECWQELNN